MNEPGRRTQELARALWYVGRGRAELRSTPLAAPAPAEALVRTAVERAQPRHRAPRLRGPGRAPSRASACGRRCRRGISPFRSSTATAPSGVSRKVRATLAGRTVFALHPHQDRFAAPAGSLALVPPAVPARRAVLARQHGDGAQRGSGIRAPGRATGSSSSAPAWSACSSALSAAAPAGGGGHDGRRRSVARRHRPPSRLRLPEAARRARRGGPRLPRERDLGRACLRARLRRPRGGGRRDELVRRRRRCGRRSGFPSTAAA